MEETILRLVVERNVSRVGVVYGNVLIVCLRNFCWRSLPWGSFVLKKLSDTLEFVGEASSTFFSNVFFERGISSTHREQTVLCSIKSSVARTFWHPRICRGDALVFSFNILLREASLPHPRKLCWGASIFSWECECQIR